MLDDFGKIRVASIRRGQSLPLDTIACRSLHPLVFGANCCATRCARRRIAVFLDDFAGSQLIGIQVPGNRLWVRVPCPPLLKQFGSWAAAPLGFPSTPVAGTGDYA